MYPSSRFFSCQHFNTFAFSLSLSLPPSPLHILFFFLNCLRVSCNYDAPLSVCASMCISLENHSITVRIRKLTPVQYYCLIYKSYSDFSKFPSNILKSKRKSLTFVFIQCHVSLASFNVEYVYFSGFFGLFMTLTFLKSVSILFYIVSLHFGRHLCTPKCLMFSCDL